MVGPLPDGCVDRVAVWGATGLDCSRWLAHLAIERLSRGIRLAWVRTASSFEGVLSNHGQFHPRVGLGVVAPAVAFHSYNDTIRYPGLGIRGANHRAFIPLHMAA